MTSRNGQLDFSPEELQVPKRGIAQQALEEDAKQTYVIIIKQEDENGDVTEAETSGSLQVLNQSSSRQSLDGLRKNLSNIGDDEYDSGISSANLFLKDDELEDVEEAEGLVLPSAKRTRIHEDPPPHIPVCVGNDPGVKGVVKRNLFCSELSPITPPAGSVKQSKIVMSASPDLFQGTTTQASGSFNTPTPSLDYKTHPAVRKIILVSPNQYPTPSSTNVLTPPSAAAVKSLYAPSPLASSTPITSASTLNISGASPDSGISLSVSSLSSTVLTPGSQNLSSQSLHSSQGTPEMIPSSVTTTQSGPGQPIKTKITFSRRPMSASMEKKDTELSDDGADKSLDTSLANIQWLGAYQLGEKPARSKTDPPTVATRWTSEERGRRKEYNHDEIVRVNRECGRTKRPPYSYMVLIQMALQSRADQKMTLREICKWIEETFAFYKYTAKPGWKNSIRHNLSYYQCFIRTSEDKKKHGARWTLKFDDEKQDHRAGGKDKTTVDCIQTTTQLPGMIPLFINQNNPSGVFQPSIVPVPPSSCSSLPQLPQQPFPFHACFRKKRTGPMPILPRPSPVQAYALVPLHNVPQQQQQQQQPIIVHFPSSQHQVGGTPAPTETTSSVNTPVPIACAPTPQHTDKSIQPGLNILRQAWLNADVSEDENALTSILKEQGISVAGGQTEKKQTSKQLKASATQGLPKPKIYAPKPKKRTRSRIKKLPKVPEEKTLLAESSDSEPDDQFEKGLPTPLRQLFQSPDDKNKSELLTTSTPLRNATISPEHLPSPIRGLTPLRGTGPFDGSFLDILQEEAVHALKLIGSPQFGDGQKTGRSPNNSLTEFGIFQISPDKGGKNLSDYPLNGLSRIFADFDTNFMTENDGLPIDMSNFNWSGLQQATVSPKDDDKKS
ncbi:forkhead box protein M1-like [Haliotis asinina]|uniref:forkhead box protein M1-like n=1 Tax=Haliotis asinina TaxID=109174 RepID=UPI0035327E5A